MKRETKAEKRKRLKAKIESRVEKTAGGCWLWTRSWGGAGYAQLQVDGKKLMVRRLVYELWRGTALGQTRLESSCREPRCVAPAHLFRGTTRKGGHDATPV